MKTIKTHINDFQIGDKLYQAWDMDCPVRVVTGAENTGRGYQRLFGYVENEPNVPFMIAGCDGFYEKVTK